MSLFTILTPGDKVRILRRDIWEFRNWTKRRPRGTVTRVDGGYIYVRPNGWPVKRVLELYTNEVKIL